MTRPLAERMNTAATPPVVRGGGLGDYFEITPEAGLRMVRRKSAVALTPRNDYPLAVEGMSLTW